MKKTLFGVGMMALLALTSCEKDKASNLFTDAEKKQQAEAVVDPETAAQLTFAEPNYDFGNLPTGAKVEHYYKFTNTGESPLIIKDAKGSCGCTVPEWPKEPIAPGVSDSIKIEYNAGAQKGKQHKTITLTTNTVKGKEVCSFTATLPNDAPGAQDKMKALQGS